MALQKLRLHDFRNIADASLSLHPSLNVITGDNGSGKTSLLEALYFLGFGRSFRSNRPSKVVRHEQNEFVLFAEQAELKVGLKKTREGETELRLNGESANSQSVLAEAMPVQLLHPNGYSLVESGPKPRLAYLDWGVFHVEHTFHSSWQRYKRILKQRNALLKRVRSYKELIYWDQQLVPLALELTELRKGYMETLTPLLIQFVTEYLPEYQLSLRLAQGWSEEGDLLSLLEQQFERERQLGYSTIGAHRADIKLRLDGRPVMDVVSRGQQKLLVCALLLAQVVHLYQRVNKRTIFLIDDFAAELDQDKRKLLAASLQKISAQVFVTAIDKQLLDGFDLEHCNMFHVKHGDVINEQMRVEHG